MPNLLDLPNEILRSIIDCADPGDLDHFADSSPLLKSLATNALEVHHERKQEYMNIEVFGCHEHIGHHPLYLLEQIYANPQLAWYPTSLRVECCGRNGEEHTDEDFAPLMKDEEFDQALKSGYYDGGSYWESDAVNVYKVMKVWAEDIRERVFDSGCFDEEDSKRWYNQVRRGNREAVLGLLLTLLPNLETIEFQGYSWMVSRFVEIVQCITGPRRHKNGGQVLTKLREIRLCGNEYGENFEDFDLAGWFAQLPSMRRVYAVAAGSISSPSSHAWTRTESRFSNINEIHVEYGCMGAEFIVNCLRSLKTLRKLHYDWRSIWGPASDGWRLRYDDLVHILPAIVEHFHSSLESICLKGDDGIPLEGSSASSISLKSFEKLTNASLPIQLFTFVPKTQPAASAPGKTRIPDIGLADEPQASSVPQFSRLVDILPRSMEVMEFYEDTEI